MVQFVKPLYLLLLVPLVYFTWRISKDSLSDMSRFRSRLSLGLRLAMFIMLVLSLAGARMVSQVSQQCVVFVMDVSDSISKSDQEKALAYINNALHNAKRNQKAALVTFGGDASVEYSPDTLSRIDKIYSVPNTNNTDISQALGLALAMFPEQCAKKIVLLSDGNETRGKSIEQAMLAGSDNVSIEVVPITPNLPHEALLDKMVCPSNVKIGEPFDLKLIVVAKEPTVAQIRILRNGAPAGLKAVELVKGKNVLTFQQSIPKPGNYEYNAILECGRDTHPENNIASGYTMVRGKPKVLYVEGQPGQEKYLAQALKSSDIDIEVRDRSGIPATMAQMRGYEMIVLSDVPAWNLAPEQMEMIKSGVKDLGIGFTMIGGENGFGAGGYFDTPIEDALPVDMSIRKTKILPSLSVVVVMDKSGSMGAIEGGREKIQLANDAAAAVVKLLQPIDKVGVIVCHDYPVAAVNLTPATSKDPIYAQISTIRAEGGGIAVFPSMKMANEMISGSGTRQKHVILLADGSDCDDQDGVLPLVKQMQDKRITVTTVAIGDGPHVPFLKAVAALGKGGYYLAQRATDLKAIFTKDVMTVSKSLIIEEPFTPRMDTSSSELSGIDGVPPLLGYVATSPKPTARLLMVSHKKDPILATWQYGLGKSAAFTSDCKARWSARWLSWPGYNKFWAQVIRSTMRKSSATDFQTTVDISSGVGHVVVDAVDEKGNFLNMLKFAGSVIGPDMKGKSLPIEQTGPGRYETTFDAGDVGNYVVNVAQKGTDSPSSEINVLNIPYPPEYKDITPNTQLLKQLASETSGKFAPRPDEVFTHNFRKSLAHIDLWPLLCLLAMLALPLDVAVRRMAVTPEQVVEIYRAVLGVIKARFTVVRTKKSEEPEAVESVRTLLRSRKEEPLPKGDSLDFSGMQVSEPAEKPKAESPVAAKQVSQPKSEETSPESSLSSRLLEAKKRAKKDQ